MTVLIARRTDASPEALVVAVGGAPRRWWGATRGGNELEQSEARACHNPAGMLKMGVSGPKDAARARDLYGQACRAELKEACPAAE